MWTCNLHRPFRKLHQSRYVRSLAACKRLDMNGDCLEFAFDTQLRGEERRVCANRHLKEPWRSIRHQHIAAVAITGSEANRWHLPQLTVAPCVIDYSEELDSLSPRGFIVPERVLVGALNSTGASLPLPRIHAIEIRTRQRARCLDELH